MIQPIAPGSTLILTSFRRKIVAVVVIILALYESITTRRKIEGKHLVWTVGNGDPMHGMCISYDFFFKYYYSLELES